MRIITLLLVLVFASSCRYSAPPPSSPAAAAPQAKPAEPKIENRSVLPCGYVAQHLDAQAKCSLWSGRGTQLPEEVDAVLCLGSSWVLHCQAPDNGKPEISVVFDWTAAVKPLGPDESPPKPQQPKKK